MSEPILCTGNDLPAVLADIRARGGFVEAMDTAVDGHNANYRVSYFERDAEIIPPGVDPSDKVIQRRTGVIDERNMGSATNVSEQPTEAGANPAALIHIPKQPQDASSGTNQMTPTEERFWKKVNKLGPCVPGKPELGPCWIWMCGTSHDGYGLFWNAETKKQERAHVWTHRNAKGEIPKGFERHHICENKGCVNPDHIEVLTNWEHQLAHMSLPFAINAAKTHCVHGHEYTEDNVYIYPSLGHRKCRICRQIESRLRVVNGTSKKHRDGPRNTMAEKPKSVPDAPASISPSVGINTPTTKKRAVSAPRSNEQPGPEIRPNLLSVEDRLAALQAKLAASGQLRRSKPKTPAEHARLPHPDD